MYKTKLKMNRVNILLRRRVDTRVVMCTRVRSAISHKSKSVFDEIASGNAEEALKLHGVGSENLLMC